MEIAYIFLFLIFVNFFKSSQDEIKCPDVISYNTSLCNAWIGEI